MTASLVAAFVGTVAVALGGTAGAATADTGARTLAAGLLPTAPVSNLLVNGDFSRGDLRQSWAALSAGSNAIVGWHVVAPIDYVSSAYWQTADAVRSVDLDGTPGPGAIAQTFASTPGDTYLVRFELAANTEGPPRVKHVRVSVAGTSRTFSVEVSGRSRAAMRYAHESLTFVASATTATLEFASLSRPGNWNGAVIANIVVTDGTAGLAGESARAAPTKHRSFVALR